MDIDLIEKKIRELQILLGPGGLAAHAALTGSSAHGAVSAPTASQIITRDAAGRAQIVAPSVAADIVNKGTLDTHAALTGSSAHGAVSAPTANQIITRDAAGRAQVVAPSAAADIARKDTVDAVQTNLTNHAAAVAGGSLGHVKSGTHISVDGSGNVSVLDSDKLDAFHAVSFPKTSYKTAAELNNNTTLESGIYTCSDGAGLGLEASWYHIINMHHFDNNGYNTQIACSLAGNHFMWIRFSAGGTWSSWYKIYHADNDGSGSGLDADLLDGQHASAFAPSPTGAILMWGTASPPAGWLLCNGSIVSETTYAALFAVIGHGFGPGGPTDPGGGNFYLPDFQGISPTGPGSQNINGRAKTGPSLGYTREDLFQTHGHKEVRTNAYNIGYNYPTTQGSGASGTITFGDVVPSQITGQDPPRVGAYTHGPEIGINFIIKT